MEKLLTDLKTYIAKEREMDSRFGALLVTIEKQIPIAEAELVKLKEPRNTA